MSKKLSVDRVSLSTKQTHNTTRKRNAEGDDIYAARGFTLTVEHAPYVLRASTLDNGDGLVDVAYSREDKSVEDIWHQASVHGTEPTSCLYPKQVVLLELANSVRTIPLVLFKDCQKDKPEKWTVWVDWGEARNNTITFDSEPIFCFANNIVSLRVNDQIYALVSENNQTLFQLQ